jgi:hypothetical protein
MRAHRLDSRRVGPAHRAPTARSIFHDDVAGRGLEGYRLPRGVAVPSARRRPAATLLAHCGCTVVSAREGVVTGDPRVGRRVLRTLDPTVVGVVDRSSGMIQASVLTILPTARSSRREPRPPRQRPRRGRQPSADASSDRPTRRASATRVRGVAARCESSLLVAVASREAVSAAACRRAAAPAGLGPAVRVPNPRRRSSPTGRCAHRFRTR